MSAREEVLERIRSALQVPGTHHPRTDGPPRTPGLPVPTDPDAVLDLFVERVADYRSVVERARPGQEAAAVAAALSGHGIRRVVVPRGLPDDWVEAIAGAGITVTHEHDVTEHALLEDVDAVVTEATVGIATTGTIVLDHSAGQGARRLTLVPDAHLLVVRADQVVADVPEAVARLREAVLAGRPLTWISGPSATSDIELDRVEGVHGPRTLHVVLVDPPGAG
ncbi:MAG TPA: LUD domain-containing protein [Intrasporangium sp.]|uniref:LutC/YkgG family protein n=1 Tax=Intrasporangium sp. TaxID=1925024 RepID=UPI002D77FCBF|nr:LUD domain-containing protein [Intrasporangium sp.]HET7397913.1 LUD domain-containing protein [Intrasporangium sp.]